MYGIGVELGAAFRLVARMAGALGIMALAIAGVLAAIIFFGPQSSVSCFGRGGNASWPWYMKHPFGVVMCNDGAIIGSGAAVAACRSEGVCTDP